MLLPSFLNQPRPCEIVANASEVDPKTVAMLGPKKIPWVWFPQVSCGRWGSTDGFFQNLMGARFFFHAALHWNYLSMMCVKTIGCRDIDLAKRPCGSLILIMSSQLLQETVVSKTIHHQAQGWQAGRIFWYIDWSLVLMNVPMKFHQSFEKIADFALMGRPADPSSSEIGQLHEIMVSSAVHSDGILSLRLLIFWMAWFGVSLQMILILHDITVHDILVSSYNCIQF